MVFIILQPPVPNKTAVMVQNHNHSNLITQYLKNHQCGHTSGLRELFYFQNNISQNHGMRGVNTFHQHFSAVIIFENFGKG